MYMPTVQNSMPCHTFAHRVQDSKPCSESCAAFGSLFCCDIQAVLPRNIDPGCTLCLYQLFALQRTGCRTWRMVT
jgi:hypothetical protein